MRHQQGCLSTWSKQKSDDRTLAVQLRNGRRWRPLREIILEQEETQVIPSTERQK